MFKISHSARKLAAAAALLGATALVAPAGAQTAPAASDTTQPGASQPSATPPASSQPAPSASAATHAKRMPLDRVESHITNLRKQLRITAAQQSQWDALAQVMRDNAQAIQSAIEAQSANVKTASAVDDLKSHEAIADAYSDGMKKFVPAFQALYDTMSDAQKKRTDAVFREQQERRQARVTKKS